MAIEMTAEEFFDLAASHQAKALETSAAYQQVIILAGYAAFFGVWSGVSNQIPHWVVLLGGSSMLLSVTVYIAWTVANMVGINMHHNAVSEALMGGPEGLHDRIRAAEAVSAARNKVIIRFWIPVVAFCAITAATASISVAGAGFLALARLPLACPW